MIKIELVDIYPACNTNKIKQINKLAKYPQN